MGAIQRIFGSIDKAVSHAVGFSLKPPDCLLQSASRSQVLATGAISIVIATQGAGGKLTVEPGSADPKWGLRWEAEFPYMAFWLTPTL